MQVNPSDDIVNILVVHGKATLTLKTQWKELRRAAAAIRKSEVTRQEVRDTLVNSLRDDKHMEREDHAVMLGLAGSYLLDHPQYQRYEGLRHFAIVITETPGEFSHNFRLMAVRTETEFNRLVETYRADDTSGFMILRGR